eukprot:2660962-Rhodomonas_salina.1
MQALVVPSKIPSGPSLQHILSVTDRQHVSRGICLRRLLKCSSIYSNNQEIPLERIWSLNEGQSAPKL